MRGIAISAAWLRGRGHLDGPHRRICHSWSTQRLATFATRWSRDAAFTLLPAVSSCGCMVLEAGSSGGRRLQSFTAGGRVRQWPVQRTGLRDNTGDLLPAKLCVLRISREGAPHGTATAPTCELIMWSDLRSPHAPRYYCKIFFIVIQRHVSQF